MRALVDILTRLAEGETRSANSLRYGTVSHVDPAKQRMRLRLGGTDDEPFLSPWMPYGQTAGALKLHNPPSVGQQFAMMSNGGDYRQSIAIPFTFSDDNSSPSDKGDEHVLTFGPYTIRLTASTLEITAGNMKTQIDPGYVKARVGAASVAVRDQQVRGAVGTQGRFICTDEDASLRFGMSQYIYANASGCWSSSPINLGPPPKENIFDVS